MVSALFEKAHPLLQYPVLAHETSVRTRLKDIWEKALNFARVRGKLKDKTNFNHKLDRLFDILYCRCPILLCKFLPIFWSNIFLLVQKSKKLFLINLLHTFIYLLFDQFHTSLELTLTFIWEIKTKNNML